MVKIELTTGVEERFMARRSGDLSSYHVVSARGVAGDDQIFMMEIALSSIEANLALQPDANGRRPGVDALPAIRAEIVTAFLRQVRRHYGIE